MNTIPKISVVVPCYNYGAFLSETLCSIEGQDFMDYEVIVVDDGSTDQTREVVASFESRFGEKLCYVYQPNSGVASARNKGVKMARGRYVGFLDADDIWLPDALLKLVTYLESYPSEAMVYAKAVYFESKTGRVLGQSYGQFSPRRPRVGTCADRLFLDGNFISIMTSLLRREVFDSVGYFDETLRVGEDYDFWLRLTCRHPIGYLDQVLCRVRRHGNNLTLQSVPNAKSNLKIAKKILKLHPDLSDKIGTAQVRDRFYILYYNLGLALLLAGRNRVRARCFLRKAWQLHLHPYKSKLILYFLFSYLPGMRLINRIRNRWHAVRKSLTSFIFAHD